jgi:hypothetical protein
MQIYLKSDKNNREFTWLAMLIYDKISLNSSWTKKFSGCAVFEETIKTRILYK